MNRRIRTAIAVIAVYGLPIQAPLPKPAVPRAFEVASIKANTISNGVRGGCHGIDSKMAPDDQRANVPLVRCVITAGRLSHLMSMAFTLPLQRISGFPDWDGPSRFDIEAKADDPSAATEQQLLSMLQSLLIDRFKLVLHRDTSEMPVFDLVVGTGGAKQLQASAQDAKSNIPEPKGIGLVFKGYSMPDLAEFLSNLPSVGRAVRDKTGLTGRYDFTLTNVLDTKVESIQDYKFALGGWQSAINDVQDQLGLRFESQKASFESIVIDHAEKPALN